ncbi:MAG: AmmeMemoRadiSam system protein B [Pseudomonadota bacterium]
MKQRSPLLIPTILACGLMLFVSGGKTNAEVIRKPAYAGAFYPAERSDLAEMIERLTRQVKTGQAQKLPQTSLKALILPHAGYVYSGQTAAYASLVLNKNQYDKVIVLAPDHRIGFANAAVSDVVAYETPLGLIKLNDAAAGLRRQSSLFQAIPDSDRYEHSLEVVLPFLQYYLKNFELVPIVVGQGDIDRMTAQIDPLLDDRTLVVVSSDLSHYLPYSEAVARDQETIGMILNLDSDHLRGRDNAACGIRPILMTMSMARRHGWQPLLLHYENSGDTAGGRQRVVGYSAIAFYGGSAMQGNPDSPRSLNPQQGQTLLKLARQTLSEKFGRSSVKIDPDLLADKDFQARRGTFVTLTIDGQLRGCIGNLEASESIREGIRRNAVNAAFHDPRFPKLDAKELDKIQIEVSILTDPQPLEYRDSQDLIAKLRPHVDGVILRKGSAAATFLPQVWEQLPQPEMFLSHLCRKAGLPGDTWQKDRLEILTYQVQYFEEKK